MADMPQNGPIPVVGTHPQVRKPAERSRIHSDGDVPREEDTDDGGGQAQGAKPADKPQSQDADAPEKTPVYKRPFFWVLMALVVIGTVVGVIYWLHSRDYESTDDAFIEAHVVQISPQVSARVLKVYVDDNTPVKAGDPLVDLDPTDYRVAVDQAKGSEDASAGKLEQVKAQVTSARAAADEAKANLDATNVAFENADADLKRYEALDARARSKQQYDNAVTAQKNAAANVAQSKARVASAESQIAVAVANVTAAQGDYETSVANRRRAEVNLGYCHIVTPTTLTTGGRVTTKNVEPGMYATMGSPLMAVVQDDVWVVANFKETQLARMRLGQPVTIGIDAYPDKDFNGRIDSIQAGTGSRFSVLPAENATGNYVKVVQRVPVKITFDEGQSKDAEHLLAPGMSVVPYVKIR